jgi:hypothetical protein
MTYSRDIDSKEIDKTAQVALYCELRGTWRDFRKRLPDLYAAEFTRKLKERKEPYASGELSEFRNCNLD